MKYQLFIIEVRKRIEGNLLFKNLMIPFIVKNIYVPSWEVRNNFLRLEDIFSKWIRTILSRTYDFKVV